MSYLWTVGYYVEIGFKVPEGVTTITITNVTFPIEDSTYFKVTVLNPSYSKADANIISITIVTIIDDVETIYSIPAESIGPSIPYPLRKSEAITFRCNSSWGEFAGQTIRVVVFLQDDSGATFPFKAGKVKLEIVKAEFDTTVTVERFNVTIRNSAESLIPLNVTEILFDSTSIPPQNMTIHDENATLPQQLQPGQNKTFTCYWNLWEKGSLGSSHNITAKTSQGYSAVSKTASLPPSVSLNITDLTFTALPDTSGFNVTVSNLPSSPHFVNINRVAITNGTQIFENITTIGDITQRLMPGDNLTLQCLWNWTEFKGQEIKVTVYTAQGFFTQEYTRIELPVASFTYLPTAPDTGETVTFDASESYDPNGTIVRYLWDFGDGTNETGEVTTHTYANNGNYTVTLIVTDNNGLTDKTSADIKVLNKLPIVSFTESATSVLTDENIYFNATESYDPDGSIVGYFWDFGDGTNTTGLTVEHAYSDDGNYTVTLTATDDDGDTASTTATKTVLNRPPVSIFTESAETVYTSEVITFNASGSYDPDGTIVSYFWDFSDGTNASGAIVEHTYIDNGNYTVTLTVTDDDGATASINATKTVLPSPPLVALFTESAEIVYAWKAVEFNANNSYDPKRFQMKKNRKFNFFQS
ncbi:MAG: PKD domain-containing protein [Candidatus Bathyarchaeota archaeon]|nr:PKD domain-containing protein [Candidatus Bathyarchaeota archaeon]